MCRKITKEKQQIKYGFMRRDNQGFTLVEMVVTLVVLSIMLSLSIGGLLAWQDWSDFQKENEYAQTLYIAAQNQLSEFSADGRLAELQESLSGGLVDDKTGNQYEAVGLNLTDSVSLLKDTDGVAYSLDALYPESIGKDNVKKYQDEIVSLRAKTGDYQLYLDDPDGLKASNPEAYWVFELLGAYVYDTSILNGSREGDGSGNGAAICVEITPENGQVFSVLYSDRNDRFIYVGVTGDTFGSTEGDGIADIADRETSYRRERMVGYYGVDSLYAATKNEVIQPSISTVKLYNKDTFYLTCRLSAKYRDILTSQLTYDLDLDASKDVNDKKLTIRLDGSKLKNESHAEAIDCPVFRYDEDGNKIELGEFPVLAWVEPDYTIHVILDAADIQATTYLYDKELQDIRSEDKASSTKFSKTFSFFRFGVAADNVYASVTATGEGFTPSKTVSNFGNLNLFKNQTEKHTCFAGETETEHGNKTAFTYSVKNARHLYNIRYIEDLTYEREAGSAKDADKIESVTFVLKSDIDWQEFQKDGQLYNSYNLSNNLLLSSLNERLVDADRKVISNVTRYNCDFPSLSQIRERDVIDGNNKTISGIAVSEISNALYGIYFSDTPGSDELNQIRPTGLVTVNYGEINELNLDEITASGSDFVGGFCGVNAGKVSKLTTKNEKDNSLISGKKHVGGIIGFQIPYDNKVELKELINNAEVNGVHAVGGILGMVRNNFELDSFDADELTGLSKQQKNILKNSNALKITISQCENYGAVAGINSSELKEIYTSKEASESTNTVNSLTKNSKTSRVSGGKDDPQEPRYIGGIVGYCYNVHKNNSENDNARITIEECISAPLYKDEAFLSIVSDEDKLNEKLKGVYVGGIVGYNYYGQIKDCGTSVEKGKEGCLFGYRYVGGIVGFNIGPASVIASTDDSGKGENDNHVIAYQYAGGITGCNANARDVDSDKNDISADGGKDPEKLEGLLLPDSQRDLQVKIDNWINKGVVIAVDEYAGGITGYNAGYIYRCNSDVKYVDAEKFFEKLYSGNYAGGIAGYNNGIIGNTERKVNGNTIGSVIKQGDQFSTVCYVKGHHYVGGIVGYNDVDSIVEDYEIGSGYVFGDEGSCFVGGYAGFNASVDLLMNTTKNKTEARFIHSNPNHVKGTYFVGGNIGGNIINMADNHEVDKINGVFLTDNFLGVLEGKAFVGGFIGYNLLIDNDENTNWIKNDDESYRGGVYIVQRQIIDAFEKSDASVSDAREALLDKKEILDNLSERLDLKIKPSADRKVCISGKESDSTKVSFGTISGEIFVGGVLGYNDSDTGLLIQNVENATPIEALKAVKCADEQILYIDEATGEKTCRTTDYIGRDKIYTYSYAGGIIGKVSRNTELDNCWNASTGTVTTAGTYTGGLCEINEGLIKNCDVSSFGSSTQDYVGGLCGLNKSTGTIKDCTFSKKTVSGRNVVGGIATENFGTISNIQFNNSKMLVEGKKVGTEKEGVTGLYAAYNGVLGKIELGEDIENVSVTSGGRYVGLVTGINEGSLINKKKNANTGVVEQLVLKGSVKGYRTTGGLTGLNCNQEETQVISYFTNASSVVATNGNAGGIIGENNSKNTIKKCINNGVVTASDEGNAGGITSTNDGLIEDCTDLKSVRAPEGMCGGIVAINVKNGKITNCKVEPGQGLEKLTFISTKAVGGVAAQNAGLIEKNSLTKIVLTNETDVPETSIGVIAGDNLKGGRIYIADSTSGMDTIADCEIIVESNYSNAGGIAGTNAGEIKGVVDKNTKELLSVVNGKISMDRANVASIGGIAGLNTGIIHDVAVDSAVQGNLGSIKNGYGGIAGYSGFVSKKQLQEEQKDNAVAYPAVIQNCSFDGVINAIGSSGAPARVGGIAGINGYGSLIEDCYIGSRKGGIDGNVSAESQVTYVTAGDYINKNHESYQTTDTKSYSFLGGIAGDNYGKVSACDNVRYSTDTVHIIGFAGETAGIVGYNYPYAIVSGYLDQDGQTEHRLSTGKDWIIEQRCATNDRGPGGIIGKCDSSETISYVTNYASVDSLYFSNTYAAGFISVLEQQTAKKTKFEYCENYGDITSVRCASGFVGLLKSNGASFENCKNYGTVFAMENKENAYAGGFIGRHHGFIEGFDFSSCENHGKISAQSQNNKIAYAGGFVAEESESMQTTDSYFYDCVNTGAILAEDLSGNNKIAAGQYYGQGSGAGRLYFELCRNYNASIKNGFVGRNGMIQFKNCFDNSNGTITDKNCTPITGWVNNTSNGFYLDENSTTDFSHDNYGVYFSLHEGSPDYRFWANDCLYHEMRNNAYYFSEPNTNTRIATGSKTPKLYISLTYDEGSQGLDSFVTYFWNDSKLEGSAAKGTFRCAATFYYADGTTSTVTSSGTAQGTYDLSDASKIVLQNPSDDKKPVSIELNYSGDENVCMRGFAYIPVERTDVEAVCNYLSNKNDTSFSINSIVVNGNKKNNFDNKTLGIQKDHFYREYPNDALDINWGDYTCFGTNCQKNQMTDITFTVGNGDNASGMEAFVFYLANNNTTVNASASSRDEKKYKYYVTFTDKYGNSIDTGWIEDATGYDSSIDDYRNQSRQEVSLPAEFQGMVDSITLHIIPTNSNNVRFRGFAWIPIGQTEQKMASGLHSGTTKEVANRSVIKWMVDTNGTKPYIYSLTNYQTGFYMDFAGNNPINSQYYDDQSDYFASLTSNKNSGSRIDTFLDIDPKMVSEMENLNIVYYKLSTPGGLVREDKDSVIKYSWKSVKNACGYEVSYRILDQNENMIEETERIIGSLQTTYSIPIQNSWAENHYQIQFSVRAVNAYHLTHDDENADNYDPQYDRYDSDTVEVSGATVKKVLPKPQVHIEFVAGNRAIFVLDNYDEYVEEGCTDCTIDLQYYGKNYSWNVSEYGKYRRPETVNGPGSGLAKMIYYAKPNDDLKDYYVESEKYAQMGEGLGSNQLPNNDRYCTTSFSGFYGLEADSMEYKIVFSLNSNDSYLLTDISAYDEKVGATVSYDSEITHAANSYSGSTVYLTSTLKDLPKEWFAGHKADQIVARAYPYRSQYELIHYGHEVVEGISLDGNADENREILGSIIDDKYIPADGTEMIENPVWDTDRNDLKSGYVLQKQDDGTYNIYYSALIEMSQTNAALRRTENNEPYREYYKYAVDYCIYSDMEAETNGDLLVNSADFQESYWARGQTDSRYYAATDKNSNEKKRVQEIQTEPIVESATATTNAEGNTIYSFAWDKYYQDDTCWDQEKNRYESTDNKYMTKVPEGMFQTWDDYVDKALNHAGLSNLSNNRDLRRLMLAYYSSYSNAKYRVDLVGTTLDGQEVILSSQNVEQATELPDVDSMQTKGGLDTIYHVWDFECEFTDTDNTWGVYPMITARIMRLGSMESPAAYINSVIIRTDANGSVYVLPRYAESSISQKLKLNTISKPDVVLHRENGQFITNDLVYDISWGAISDENQKADLGGYLIKVIKQVSDISEDTNAHYFYVKDCQTDTDEMDLDLVALEAAGIVVTDVTQDYVCEDHQCRTMINLSDFNTDDVVEISVQAIARKQAEIYENSADGVTMELTIPNRLHVPDVEKLSKKLAIGGGEIVNSPISRDVYLGGVAFSYTADDYSDASETEVKIAVALFHEKEDGAENDKSLVTDDFSTNALKVLCSKDEPLNLGKVAENPAPAVLDLTEFERYPGEYAGKWLKIALQATSSTKIDSQWSDKDQNDATINYVWIQIPPLQLNDVNLIDLGETDGKEDVVRYACDGNLSDVSTDVNRETPISTKSLCFEEDRNVNGYSVSVNGIPATEDSPVPFYNLYLQRHLTDENDAESFDGSWDVYLQSNSVLVTPLTEQKPVCEQNVGAVWVGMLGENFDINPDDDIPAPIYPMIQFISIGMFYQYDSQQNQSCYIPMQIRYQVDEHGMGSFVLVMPDVTQVNETNVNETSQPGANFTSKVVVSQYLKEERPYVIGADGIYERTVTQP